MDKLIVLLGYMFILCVVSAVGAYLPQIRKMDDRQTHFLIALSAGIFLGLLFVLLIPEAYELLRAAGFSAVTAFVRRQPVEHKI
jgi:hypothetical protein